ncbi:MAG: DUF4358 domain-containing protein [Lachnospiraceae bacterium]|nr:DUF4358 domain-containing protein [Lachnospiraceae bacterium]
MKNSMRKIMIIMIIGSLFLLSGCGEDNMSEDELVDGRETVREQDVEDVEAGNFPLIWESTGQKERQFYTLVELEGEVKELLGDNYWPEVNLSAAELQKLTGITEDMYVDFLAERQILDAHIDTMIIIHAKEDYVGAVEQAIETYRSGLIEQNRNYPQNLSKARASRIETIDDYICFVQLGADTTALADRGNEAVMAHCLEENEKALYVLEQAILQ